jgi:hypothetical protein
LYILNLFFDNRREKKVLLCYRIVIRQGSTLWMRLLVLILPVRGSANNSPLSLLLRNVLL